MPAWYWHRVVRELEARGHEAVAVGLTGPDESSGLPEYAEAVLAAIGGRRDVVVVGQSLGGFTAPVACARARVRLLVLVNPMIPLPGETPGEWWGNTGWGAARIAAAEAGGYPTEFELAAYFLHDVPADIVAAGESRNYPEAGIRVRPAVRHRPLAGRADPGGRPAERTGSSRWTSSGGWPGSGSPPRLTSYPAATWPRCRAPPSSPPGSSATCDLFRRLWRS